MTSYQDYVMGVNQAIGGLMGVMIVALIFIVIFVVTLSRQGQFDNSLAFSGFISTILSILMWGAGFITLNIVILPAVLTVFAIFLIIFRR